VTSSVEPGLRERSPGKWEIRAYNKATGRQEYTFYDSGRSEPGSGIRTARTKRAELISDIAKGKYGGQKGTLTRLIEDYIDDREKRGHSPTTIRSYRQICRAVADGVGSKRLDRLKAKDLDDWYAKLLQGGMSAATLGHYHRLISSALGQAEKWEWVPSNVAKLATVPRAQKADLKIPPPDRVRRLIDHAASSRAPDMAAIVLTAALTGLRRGELCGLRWSDIDWGASTLTVERSIWQTGRKWGVKLPKSHQARVVPVGELATSTLRFWRGEQDAEAERAGVELVPEAYIFSPNPDGADPKMPDVVSQRFRKHCEALEAAEPKAAPWPYRFHDLRHYQATELLAAGYDPGTVSRRLGHSKVSTTMDIYVHHNEERAISAAGALDAGLATSKPSLPV
jgi:integrase